MGSFLNLWGRGYGFIFEILPPPGRFLASKRQRYIGNLFFFCFRCIKSGAGAKECIGNLVFLNFDVFAD